MSRIILPRTVLNLQGRALKHARCGYALPGIALCLAVAVASALGCGWFGINDSVRFGPQGMKEFERLPPLSMRSDGLNADERREHASGGESEEDSDSYEDEARQVRGIDETWNQAQLAEERGDLPGARRLLRDYLARTSPAYQTYGGPKDLQPRRNSALDQLDALALLNSGVQASAVRAYLDARRAYDAPASADHVREALDAVPLAPALKANVEYLRAALAYRENDYAGAARAFRLVASRYPGSDKHEAALFMQAVATMKLSEVYQHATADGDGKDSGFSSSGACPDCRDGAWRAARAVLTRLIHDDPHGRYSHEARGWLAYLSLYSGDRAGALVEYFRLLGDETDRQARLEGLSSLRLTLPRANDEDLDHVEAAIANEPAAAMAYAYYGIYNYGGVGDATGENDSKESSDSGRLTGLEREQEEKREENERQRRAQAVERKQFQRVAAFATRLMHRYPDVATSAGFALRVAEADLELGDNISARESARRALKSRIRAEERVQALWVEAVAGKRLHDYRSARQSLNMLVALDPNGRHADGARRLLAIVAEEDGDLDGALEQYLALNYREDTAYFVDVLMTPEQLAAFVEHHPESQKLEELRYALGIRYLRAGRYAEARSTLSRVRTTGGNSSISSSAWQVNTDDDTLHYSKDMRFPDSADAGVRTRWIERDIQTAEDLERLERAAESAQGDEARAEARYQLASYLFQAPTVLFYNPAAWRGLRYVNLCFLDEQGNYLAPGETEVLWKYMQEHEPVARALVIYLEIVRRFPHTRAAPDALYTAAVCHQRLSGYNDYWRRIYATDLHAGDRMVTYDDVKRAYPKYRFPRGTLGWEPSTRTVNGGPGWAAPPKPRPRPGRFARIKLKLDAAWLAVNNFWEQQARRWLALAFMSLGALFVSALAGRARRLLSGHMGRCASRVEMSSEAAVARELRDDLRLALRRRFLAWRAMALDASARPVLALYLVTHTMLAALLLAFAWTYHYG